MAKMRAIQVSRPNGPFEYVEREIPEPGEREVRLKVQACGICHSDSFTKEGSFPHVTYPRVPGHEVAGIIDALGPNVANWRVGERVGIGWYGGHCGFCESCRRGDFVTCSHLSITGVTYDGGYADYMIASVDALALIPEEISAVEAGPLMCAGITTFNALRNTGACVGEIVAVLGIGGLGHLAVQFASKMGFQTIAIARGKDKEILAKRLGAHHYIDSLEKNPAQELAELGGAKVLLSTVTEAEAIESALGGLSINGKCVIVGATHHPLSISAAALISGRRSITGWPSGTSIDSQDTLSFSALTGVRSMNEAYPFEKVDEAYEKMMSGRARFRIVLLTGN
ncbi:alcohol dehydrogenase [Parachlamydia sp. AcF125]|uniref:alcohol dehydrogenase n=1 Tax=Parachlamydia sp. AcF125 TaxID=2795736 RepID=UPI001BCA5CB3|nr:alcohol dehydrogenase [Parachlamydia sp. AcF125]MBS4168868.1 alcohol dehydrogenase [Parachlamydia sp. AcF125]